MLFAFGILVFFGIAGQHLVRAMGISLASFQIAGGIISATSAWLKLPEI